MQLIETKIPGCYKLVMAAFEDARGKFVKTFHQGTFQQHHLETNFAETYYSFSYQNILRGLHFQIPPYEHTKLVHCIQGEIIDAVVDLRVDSPTFGKYETFELTEKEPCLIYIPAGLAHGFYISSPTATVLYQVSTVYAPNYERGISWDSIGIPWPSSNPLLSDKDRKLPPFDEFESPFTFKSASA